MKTYKNLFQEIVSFENLDSAYLKARKNKKITHEMDYFKYNLETELFSLQTRLINESYKPDKYRTFILNDTKKRVIKFLSFRDRVVQHAICNIIEPIFDKSFITGSYACRKNKGTHEAVKKTFSYLQKKSVNKGYCLKIDIKKYFPSIDHDILIKLIKKKIADKKLLNLLELLIRANKKGLPIGNLTSQLFANIYLNEMDKLIKHKLKVKHYLRYMDDLVLFDSSSIFLELCKEEINKFAIIKLKLNIHKVHILKANSGIYFLGYVTYQNKILPRKSTVKRIVKKAKIKLYNSSNNTDFETCMKSFASWHGYFKHSNSNNLIQYLYKKYFKMIV